MIKNLCFPFLYPPSIPCHTSLIYDTIIPMAKKNKMPIDFIEARKAMDLATRDCNTLWRFALLLESMGIVKDKDLLHSRDLWGFNFLRELYHLKRIRPDLSKLIQRTIDDYYKKGP